jgi:hypothetical protein
MTQATFTVETSGSTLTDGTLQTLATSTTLGAFQVMWDLSVLQNGDIVELHVLAKTLTGSTAATVFHGVFGHAQAEPVKVTPMILSPFQLIVKMKLTDGTNRTIDWSLNRI